MFIFVEIFYLDWSFLEVLLVGIVFYGIMILFKGGNILFVDQVVVYEWLFDVFWDKVDEFIVIYLVQFGYVFGGVYGDSDQDVGCSMKIFFSEKVYEK